jgi:hypothetical protein
MAEVNNAVGADPFPVVPAAYICTLAFTIGAEPADSFPVNAIVGGGGGTMVIGVIELDPHPLNNEDAAATAIVERKRERAGLFMVVLGPCKSSQLVNRRVLQAIKTTATLYTGA